MNRYHDSFLRSWSLLARRVSFRADSMARMCQISIRTLQRHIRAEYGVTLRAWLAECRLHEARVRLAAGERAKVVAIDLGFKHPANFTRAFKNRFGVPPRTFAKSAERALSSSAPGLGDAEVDKAHDQLEVLAE